MLAKCAACPPSCMSVVRAPYSSVLTESQTCQRQHQRDSCTCPEPTAAGDAREVKLAAEGTHVPSFFRHAGCGQWQNPLLYLPAQQRDN
eukprot:scaffold706_cov418-Prasinococcus_capsulatus_cf.AAC.50